MLITILVLVATVTFVHSSPTTTQCDNSLNSSICLFKFKNVVETAQHFQQTLKTPEDAMPWKNACKSYLPCGETLNCTGETKQLVESVTFQCSIITFFGDGFKDCMKKLLDENKSCLASWNVMALKPPSAKLGPRPEEVCQKLFGKDECMKTVVTEKCGLAKFEELKKVMTYGHKDFDNCGL